MTRLLILLVLGGCFRVGPVKIGLMPGLPMNQRDPDRTRNFVQEPAQPNGEGGGGAAAGEDPLSVGPVSGGLTITTYALSRLAGLRAYFGVYGTFDETGLVELDPDKREEQSKLRAKANEAGRAHANGSETHGDGMHNDGTHGDGTHGDGAHGDGTHGDGTHGTHGDE